MATALEGVRDARGRLIRLGLFSLHHLDWLHIETPQRDKGTLKSGHPDYLLIGDGWCAYLEIKAHDKLTGYMGRLKANQRSFHEKLTAAGQEVFVAWLPDDLAKLNAWLEPKTGRSVNIDGLLAPERVLEGRAP